MTKQSDKVFDEIRSYAKLPIGWDFGDGDPISQYIITLAEALADIGIKHGYELGSCPQADGGISISFYQMPDECVDITIEPPDMEQEKQLYSIRHEKGIGSEYDILYEKENMELEEMIVYLDNWIPKPPRIEGITFDPDKED